MSERQFRRYRGRYEEDGAEGLVDRRLGKPSPKRVPAADVQLMLELYGDVYRGWNVKHFHEHLVQDHGLRWGYTWVKTQLHAAGLVERAQRRGARAHGTRVGSPLVSVAAEWSSLAPCARRRTHGLGHEGTTPSRHRCP